MAGSFTTQIAMQLIRENNGGTAQEIVRYGLDRGIISSRGRSRSAGQVGAFVKMYNDGRLSEVYRDEQHRPYRYYLKSSVPVQPSHKLVSEPVTFRPTPKQEEVLAALTETRRFSSRSEAIIWLLDQGITANQVGISRIMDAHTKIEQLRQQVQQIGP